MRVVVELLGPVREALGASSIDVDVAEGATVRELVAVLVERGGEGIRPLLSRCRWAAGSRVVDEDEPLDTAVTMTVIPPVSGGDGAGTHHPRR